MKNEILKSLKGSLLQRILPFFLGALIVGAIVIIFVGSKVNILLDSYLILIGTLFILTIIAYIFTLKKSYRVSLYLTLLITIIGVWAPLLFNVQSGKQDIFILMYLVLPILYSSLVLPLTFTLIFTLVQIGFIMYVGIVSVYLSPFDKGNLLFFIVLIAFFGILTNHVSNSKNKEYHEGAILDYLTGLFNRRYLDVTLIDWIKKNTSQDTLFGVIIADIDNFKNYNDNFGHSIGDSILQKVAVCLSEEVKHPNIVCRYGGDEFAIIVVNPIEPGISKVAKRIQDKIKGIDYSQLGVDISEVTLTMGLSVYPMDGLTYKEIIDAADKNLIEAKKRGKDRIAY